MRRSVAAAEAGRVDRPGGLGRRGTLRNATALARRAPVHVQPPDRRHWPRRRSPEGSARAVARRPYFGGLGQRQRVDLRLMHVVARMASSAVRTVSRVSLAPSPSADTRWRRGGRTPARRTRRSRYAASRWLQHGAVRRDHRRAARGNWPKCPSPTTAPRPRGRTARQKASSSCRLSRSVSCRVSAGIGPMQRLPDFRMDRGGVVGEKLHGERRWPTPGIRSKKRPPDHEPSASPGPIRPAQGVHRADLPGVAQPATLTWRLRGAAPGDRAHIRRRPRNARARRGAAIDRGDRRRRAGGRLQDRPPPRLRPRCCSAATPEAGPIWSPTA